MLPSTWSSFILPRHYLPVPGWMKGFISVGFMKVSFFFMLSGFILACNYPEPPVLLAGAYFACSRPPPVSPQGVHLINGGRESPARRPDGAETMVTAGRIDSSSRSSMRVALNPLLCTIPQRAGRQQRSGWKWIGKDSPWREFISGHQEKPFDGVNGRLMEKWDMPGAFHRKYPFVPREEVPTTGEDEGGIT